MSALVLRWRKPAPPILTVWRGADARVAALAAEIPPGPIAAVIGPPGPAGGGGASATVIRTAAEAIGGHRVVRLASDGRAHLAGPADADADAVIGLSVGAAVSGAAVTIQISGEISESGWFWAAGPVWLGANGVLTQILPATGALMRVGTASGPSTLIINPRLIARL